MSVVPSKMVPKLKFTMADFRKWPVEDVAEWIRTESAGIPLLERELEKNLYAFAEYNGARLNRLSSDDMLDLGCSFKSRDILIRFLEELRENEKCNTNLRPKADRLWKAFCDSDDDGNGIVTKEELTALVQSSFPGTSDLIVTVYYDLILEACDPAKSGQILINELKALDHQFLMMKIMSEAASAEQVETVFHELDADASGFLDKGELENLLDRAVPDAGKTLRRRYITDILKEASHPSGITLMDIFRAPVVKQMLKKPDSDSIDALPLMKALASPARIRSSSPSQKRTPRTISAAAISKPVDMRCAPISPRLKIRPESLNQCRPQSPNKQMLPKEMLLEPDTADPDLNFQWSASELMNKAEAIVEDGWPSHNQWQEAVEFMTSAGKKYREQGEFKEAAQSFERAHDCLVRLGRHIEAAEMLRHAACCAEVDPVRAVAALTEAVDIYTEHQRPRLAGILCSDIATIVANQGVLETAVDWLLKALEYLEAGDRGGGAAEEHTFVRHRLMVQVVQLYARLELYDDAGGMCEQIYRESRANSQPSWAVDALFWKSLMSLVTLPLDDAAQRQQAADKLQTAFGRFQQLEARSKEHLLLATAGNALKSGDLPGVMAGLHKWSQMHAEPMGWLEPVFTLLLAKLGVAQAGKEALEASQAAATVARETALREAAANAPPPRRSIRSYQ